MVGGWIRKSEKNADNNTGMVPNLGRYILLKQTVRNQTKRNGKMTYEAPYL